MKVQKVGGDGWMAHKVLGPTGGLVSQVVGVVRIVQSYTIENGGMNRALPLFVSSVRYEDGEYIILFKVHV